MGGTTFPVLHLSGGELTVETMEWGVRQLSTHNIWCDDDKWVETKTWRACIASGRRCAVCVNAFAEGITCRQPSDGLFFLAALHLNGADADIEQVLISDPQTEAGGRSGFAMQAFPHEGTLEPTIVAMRATRIERSKQAGIVVAGSTGTFDGLEIVDTLGTGGGALGVAFSVIVDWNIDLLGAAELRRSRVAGAHAGGVLVAGGELFVEDVEIRDVEEQANVQDFGDGLGASSLFPLSPGPQASRMIVNRSSVLGSARAGISNFGADVSVSNTFLDCNGIDLDGETVLELPFAFEDAGGNDCGCGTDRVTCKVLTTNIKPPSFL